MSLFESYTFKLSFQRGLVAETLTINSMLKIHEGLTIVQKRAVKSYHLGEGKVILVLKIFNGYNKAYFVFHIIKVHCTCTGIFFWFRCIMGREDIHSLNVFRLPLLGHFTVTL